MPQEEPGVVEQVRGGCDPRGGRRPAGDDLIKESAAMIGIMVKAGHPIEKLNREKSKIRPSLRSPRNSKGQESRSDARKT